MVYTYFPILLDYLETRFDRMMMMSDESQRVDADVGNLRHSPSIVLKGQKETAKFCFWFI
jgi:hypothetical protein